MTIDAAKHDAAAPALAALADRTRRAILNHLRERELAVGEIALRLPVTRPAVSQHLAVLRAAGLVEERNEGTRHLFRLHPRGLEALRSYVEDLRDDTRDRHAVTWLSERRERRDIPSRDIAAVVKTAVVPLAADRAFDLFFEGMGTWWPLDSHSVFESSAVGVDADTRVGGRIVERAHDGRTAEWGEFTAWDPPRCAVFTWHPGHEAASATEIEVRFTAEGELTRVDLEHRGWSALGDRAQTTRAGYDTGWNHVFAVCYASAAQAR
jgi:DNA-binding transcriptional ArsR family regulator/uncharacterized protein YndB with AHSA1/START domain